MEKTKKELPTKYILSNIVKSFEQKTGQKPVKDMMFNTDYMFGNIDEDTLLDFGFKFITMSNKAGFDTPIYRMGNIEAVFIGQVLHIYEITL